MKIALNSLFLQTPSSGSEQYLLHLLRALKEIDQQNEYLLLGPRPVKRDGSGNIAFPYLVNPVPTLAGRKENIEKLVWEQYTGPAAARKAGADLYHVPYFAPPLFPRTPTVVTIHDVIPLRLPAYQAGARVKAYMRLVAWAARNATLIITVSQHARQDMMDALHLPAERICVTYEAAGEQYRPITDPTALSQARARYGVGERYIFYLGGRTAAPASSSFPPSTKALGWTPWRR
ncbi:MAG: glycosyltransferase family 4 protein [Chloroflexi bacterium]|nr:MAG: glycosyltransferase family 4 protein [Chloroflexota bacterium]